MIDNSFNAAFSLAGARLGQAAGLMLGGRMAASFADRLETGAYAFRQLASLYQVQAGALRGGQFAPLPEAK